MPYADTHAMNEHLAEISANVAPGAHAVILVDQAVACPRKRYQSLS